MKSTLKDWKEVQFTLHCNWLEEKENPSNMQVSVTSDVELQEIAELFAGTEEMDGQGWKGGQGRQDFVAEKKINVKKSNIQFCFCFYVMAIF